MGQLLLIIGLAYLGYIFIVKPLIIKPFNAGLKGNEFKRTAPKKRTVTPEIAKEKGDKFEKYVVKKFDKCFFTIKEWRGDKYIDGLYAKSNLNPDLEIEFRLKNFSTTFALECKFRQHSYEGEIEFAKERQIHHYKKFEEERQMPVYIALGLGGNPDNPAELFLIPLKHLNTNRVSYNHLLKYKKETKRQFYFDIQDKVLN